MWRVVIFVLLDGTCAPLADKGTLLLNFAPVSTTGKLIFFFKAYRVLDEKIGSVFFVVEER